MSDSLDVLTIAERELLQATLSIRDPELLRQLRLTDGPSAEQRERVSAVLYDAFSHPLFTASRTRPRTTTGPDGNPARTRR